MSDGWEARWLFSFLDYHHYEVTFQQQKCFLCILNHVDRSATFVALSDPHSGIAAPKVRGYMRIRGWLRRHEVRAA